MLILDKLIIMIDAVDMMMRMDAPEDDDDDDGGSGFIYFTIQAIL